MENLRDSIVTKNDSKYLVYSVLSINNKNWIDVHPEHKKLILQGLLTYNDGSLIKEVILEIFKNFKIL